MSNKDGSPQKKKASMTNPSSTHRTSASYEETIVHGKKRKVWRSTASNTANMMSPEAAANYLQQAAEAAAAAAAAAAGSGGESVQITLGPNGIAAHTTSAGGMESLHWMNPSYAAARGAAAGSSAMGTAGGSGGSNPLSCMGVNMNMSMNMNLSGGHPTSVSFGNLDLAALAKAGDLSALTSAAARNVAASASGANTASFPTSGFGTNTSMMGSSTLDPRKSTPNTASTCSAASHGAAGNSKVGSGNGKESLPCSEAEMKALMSMFVEIMGMSMDTEKLGKSTAAKKRAAKAKKNGEKNSNTTLFSFGDNKNGVWPDPAIAAATGDLDALNAHRYAYSDDEEDEDDSLPDLDDMKDIQQQKQQQSTSGSTGDFKAKSGASSILTNVNAAPITGRSGIAPVEWESLEQVAIEDAMEAEERARKAAKRREKKNRKKEKARKEAAAKAAEAAAKKREKAILSWRSRLVSACQSNEMQKLKTLLNESPLTSNAASAAAGEGVDGTPLPMMTMATMTPHLEFLLPHTVAKNRTMAERGNEARTHLAYYLMDTNLPLVFTTPLRTGRTALHTACLYGELDFVEHALQCAQTWTQEGELSTLPSTYLSTACQESGFAPIHYAILSGSNTVLEILLKAGADVRTKSIDTHTWKSSSGKGISPRELAETISHGSQEKVLETHGLALQEALSHFSSSSDEKRKFKLIIERMIERLKSIEQHGYSPPPPEPEVMDEEEEEPEIVETKPPTKATASNDNECEDQEISEPRTPEDSYNNTGKKKKKKKGKKKGNQNFENSTTKDSPQSNKGTASSAAQKNPKMEDPLVTALLGMGFTEEQITAAVKACGGTDRATADDLVVWILGAERSTEAQRDTVSPRPAPAPAPVQQPAASSKTKAKEPSTAAAEARAKEARAAAKKEEEARLKEQRLAAKREEKIRRNREWNNRAQARQKEEEQAKIAQAVAEANRAATQRAVQAAAVQQQLQQQHLQQQQAQQAQQQAQQQQAAQLAQQQQAQQSAVAAQQVLAPASSFFPSGVAPTAAPNMMPPPLPHAPSPAMNMPPPPAHYGVPSMPPPGAGYDSHGHLNPQGTAGTIMAAASRAVEVQQAAYRHGRNQSYDSTFNQLPPPPPTGVPKMTPQQSWELPSNHGAMYNADAPQYPAIADDSTVSSFGSGRVAVPPSFSATIPPGFRPAPASQTLAPPAEETASVASYEVEENPLGEMRATAKEFVPAFSSRPSSRNTAALHRTSSLPTVPPASLPSLPASEPPAASRLSRAFSGAEIAPGPAASSSIQPSGLIGGVNSFTSFLPPASGQELSSLGRLTAASPGIEHLSPVPPSAASSVTGISNSDEPQLPTGLGLDKGAPVATGTQGILEDIGLSSKSFDSTSAARGVSSIWGGIGAANGSGGNTTSSVAGIPLAGLPSLSLSSGSSKTSTLGPRSDGLGGETVLPGGLGGVGGWGSSNLGGGGSTTGGSIW